MIAAFMAALAGLAGFCAGRYWDRRGTREATRAARAEASELRICVDYLLARIQGMPPADAQTMATVKGLGRAWDIDGTEEAR